MLIQFIIGGEVVLAIGIEAVGYPVRDTLDWIKAQLGEETYVIMLLIQFYTFGISAFGWMITSFLCKIGGKCTECKHQLDMHEKRDGKLIVEGCKAKVPKKNSMFKSQRCGCHFYTSERKKKSVYTDPDTGVTVTRKDSIIVIVSWLVMVMGFRFLMLSLDPYKWLGSLGAIGLSFVTMYLAFKYVQRLQPYKAKFNAVIKRWYTRRIQILLYIYVIWNIFMVYAIEFGNEHYGQQIAEANLEGKDITVSKPQAMNQTSSNSTAASVSYYIPLLDEHQPGKLFHTLSIMLADVDRHFHGAFGATNWVFLYEEAEFIIFFVMIKTGHLFK